MGISLAEIHLYKGNGDKMPRSDTNKLKILLLSDSTGETVTAIAAIIKAQYSKNEILFETIAFFRTLDTATQSLTRKICATDIIVHTPVEQKTVTFVRTQADKYQTKVIELLTNPLDVVGSLLGNIPIRKPGQHYKVNDSYFNRMNAIDFAMYTDDGHIGERLIQADVILVGISRTSKTPTCIYLAYQGIKAANLPILRNQTPPKVFFKALKNKICMIGLVASVSRLRDIRSNRLKSLGKLNISDYTDIKTIQEELVYSRMFFARYNIPILDVTRRSIEETAATIKQLISK